ncbi:MAG: hypothetical protein IBX56_06465 [Methylomicrobium sp.]|nr:hypothetical protein [Methylomicrobium sp.]
MMFLRLMDLWAVLDRLPGFDRATPASLTLSGLHDSCRGGAELTGNRQQNRNTSGDAEMAFKRFS